MNIQDHYEGMSDPDRARLGGPADPPVADAPDDLLYHGGPCRYRRYTNGLIYQWPGEAPYAVYGAIGAYYETTGGPLGSFGHPRSDEIDTPHRRGRMNYFEHGSLWWQAGTGVYTVPEPMRASGSAADIGRWEITGTSGVVGVHATLLHTNSVVFHSYVPDPDPDARPEPQPLGHSALLDLRSRAVRILPILDEAGRPLDSLTNVFCSGHAYLPDGRLVVWGGDREGPGRFSVVNTVHTVDPLPDGTVWRRRGTTIPRWYPSCVTLADGRVAAVGGLRSTIGSGDENSEPVSQLFDLANGVVSGGSNPVYRSEWQSYPLVLVLPDGRLLVHAGDLTTFWSGDSQHRLPEQLRSAEARTYGKQGSCALLVLRESESYRARILLVGGGARNVISATTPALNSCEILDIGAVSPAWAPTTPMHYPRVMPDAVLLPDGTVFVCNGSQGGSSDNGVTPAYVPEIYDPRTGAWTQMQSATVPRLYHATALLLPDASVLTAGTDSSWNPEPFDVSELRIETFYPPYLFRGRRPVLTTAPEWLDHGADLSISTPDSAIVDSVTLARCGTTTHSFNMGQRLIELVIQSRGENTVVTRIPEQATVAVPGWYLLFILLDGVPSIGRFIRIGGPAKVDTAPPVQPAQADTRVRLNIPQRPPPYVYPIGDPARVRNDIAELTTHVSDLADRVAKLEKQYDVPRGE